MSDAGFKKNLDWRTVWFVHELGREKPLTCDYCHKPIRGLKTDDHYQPYLTKNHVFMNVARGILLVFHRECKKKYCSELGKHGG